MAIQAPGFPAIAGSLLSKEAYDRLSDIGTQSILGTTVDGQRIPGALELAERAQAESGSSRLQLLRQQALCLLQEQVSRDLCYLQ